MADIIKYLENILSSRYGEDVRGSIHDSIKAINDEVIDYGAEAGLKAAEAEKSAQAAKISAQAAADSRDNAQTSAELTAQNLVEVQRLTQETKESTANARTDAGLSKSYAVGTNGEIRENDAYDNAKSYCEQAKSVAESLGSPITPQGTLAFEDLPPLSEVGLNWMYNISNEFITTDDFAEGAGNVMPAGTNVYKIASGKWDCFAGSPVTGIKGNKEQIYRKGNVNLTPENIGALAADGDSGDNTVTFASADNANPAAWTDVPVLTTGEKHSSLFGRISTMFKNVRYLYRLLGTTDISGIGDGTATGAIKAVNTDLANVSNRFIGNWQEWGALQVTSKDRTIMRRLQIDADGVLKYVYSINAGSTWTFDNILTENTLEKTNIMFTPNLNYVVTDYSWCYKSGNAVILNFDSNYNISTKYTDYILGTVSSHHPDRMVFVNANNSLNEKIQVYLKPNGDLVLNTGESSVDILTNVRCQIIWFV